MIGLVAYKVLVILLVVLSAGTGATAVYYYQKNSSQPLLASVNGQVASLNGQIDSYKIQIANLNNQLASLRELNRTQTGSLTVSQATIQDLQAQASTLQGRIDGLQSQLDQVRNANLNLVSQVGTLNGQMLADQHQIDSLKAQVAQLQTDVAHPRLTIWTSCGGTCTMTAGSWREGGVPDTFTYYPAYTSTVDVGVYLFTFSQYVQFSNCSTAVDVPGRLNCVVGTYNYFSPTKSLNGVFHLAEGCASYVAIYYSTMSGTIYPTVDVQYEPASTVTGACTSG